MTHPACCEAAPPGLSGDQQAALDDVIEKYRNRPGALISALHEAQEAVGYLPREVQVRVAEGLGVPPSEVFGVVTFYALFSTKPKGRFKISLCKGTACYVRGAPRVLERLERELGIEAGDTTGDGLFSLDVVRCLGACGLGPVITVNEDVHARLKPNRVRSLLEAYRRAGHEDRRGRG
ncbi:MAG: NADH-quinone oxidoreductase subunit NuoE [bacterium]|nr:NADH-quinone oxidoreductase subunit NuoE [bacterium]